VWQGWPMVLPSTDRLRGLVEGDAYARAVGAAAAGLAYRVLARDSIPEPVNNPTAEAAAAPARRPPRRRGRQPVTR